MSDFVAGDTAVTAVRNHSRPFSAFPVHAFTLWVSSLGGLQAPCTPFCVCVCVPHCACRPETKQKVAEAGDIEADLMEFRELQRIVSTYLDRNTTSEARLW